MKLCEHHIHPSPLILGLLGNHVTRYFGICAVVTFILLCFCPLTTLSSLSSSCSKSAGFTPADPWFVILSLFRLDPRQHSLKDKTSQNLSSFPHLPSSHLPLVSSYFWMSQIRPSESDIPNQALEVYICSFESKGQRYVLIIHFYVESGQKMIQFNIQFKIESKIFIQWIIHSIFSQKYRFNELFIQYSVRNIDSKFYSKNWIKTIQIYVIKPTQWKPAKRERFP